MSFSFTGAAIGGTLLAGIGYIVGEALGVGDAFVDKPGAFIEALQEAGGEHLNPETLAQNFQTEADQLIAAIGEKTTYIADQSASLNQEIATHFNDVHTNLDSLIDKLKGAEKVFDENALKQTFLNAENDPEQQRNVLRAFNMLCGDVSLVDSTGKNINEISGTLLARDINISTLDSLHKPLEQIADFLEDNKGSAFTDLDQMTLKEGLARLEKIDTGLKSLEISDGGIFRMTNPLLSDTPSISQMIADNRQAAIEKALEPLAIKPAHLAAASGVTGAVGGGVVAGGFAERELERRSEATDLQPYRS